MKKCLSVILCLVMVLSVFAVIPINVFAEDKDIAETGGLSLAQLKAKFPQGAYWNHVVTDWSNNADSLMDRGDNSFSDSVTYSPCATHSGYASVGQIDCNAFGGAIQCCGFAKKISFDVYGSCGTDWGTVNVNNCKRGDVIQYFNSTTDSTWGHWVTVVGRNGNTLTLGECNWWPNKYGGCRISWDRTIQINELGTAYCHSAPFELPIGENSNPVFTIDEASDITETDAYICCSNITNPDREVMTRVGFQMGTSSGNYSINKYDDLDNWTYSRMDCNYKMSDINVTLTPGTKYYYRFYLVKSGTTYYSEEKSFTTAAPTTPVFTIDEATDITETDAYICCSNITNPDREVMTRVGFQMGTSSGNYSINKYDDLDNWTYSRMDCNYKMSDVNVILTPGTKYYYRFYLVKSGSTYYSDEKSFTTVEPAHLLDGLVDGFYYENGELAKGKGLVEFEGDIYFVKNDGSIYTNGTLKVAAAKTNGLRPAGSYSFDAEGKLVTDGIINGYYYVNGEKAKGAGVVEYNGSFYFVKNDGSVYTSGRLSISEAKTNGLLPAAAYNIDQNGKILCNGIINGYFYIDGDKAKGAGVVEYAKNLYFVKNDGTLYKNGRLTIKEDKTNGLVAAAAYNFDADGKMQDVQRIVKGYYYLNGQKVPGAGVIEYNGDLYFVKNNGAVYTSGRLLVTEAKANGLVPEGRYTFGADGKMIR